MLAVSTNGGFCYASLQAEGKEVLPFIFSFAINWIFFVVSLDVAKCSTLQRTGVNVGMYPL